MVFYRSLSIRKSSEIFRTLLSFLADLNNIVVWMVSIRSLISHSSILFTNPFGSFPSILITSSITVTLMLHSFSFSSLARSLCWYLFLFSLLFTLWSVGTAKSTIQQTLSLSLSLSLLLTISRSGFLRKIMSSVWISKTQKILSISFYKTDSDLCKYHWVESSTFNFLHNSL